MKLFGIAGIPPVPFYLRFPAFGFHPPLFCAHGDPGLPAELRYYRSSPDHFYKFADDLIPVLELGPVDVGVDQEDTLIAYPIAVELEYPVLHMSRNGRGSPDVETDLDGGGHLVDVLPSRAGGSDELFFNLSIGNTNHVIYVNHAI